MASSRPLTLASSAATWSISASICRLYSSSFASVPALMPIERVPLNIMCSWKCEMPVMPGRSFTEPTRYARMQRISGASGRLTMSTLRPLGNTRSITWLDRVNSCPPVSTLTQLTARSTAARHTSRLTFMSVLLEG